MCGQAESCIQLRKITTTDLWDILRLEVDEDQKKFVASNAISLAEALFEKRAWYRAIYAGDTPVGFVMLYLDSEKPEYSLWRLMIASGHQRKGYGRAAMQEVIDFVRTLPQARSLLTSYVPGEGNPGGFYARLGFHETGEIDGEECVMRLELY